MKRISSSLIALGALAAVMTGNATPAHAFQCAGTHAELVLLTPKAAMTALPPDGGFVVGTVSADGLAKAGATLPRWVATTDAGRAAVAEPLAPGLVVYRGPAAKRLVLKHGKQTLARATFGDSYGPDLAPPEITSVVHADHPESVGTTITVTLTAPAPAGAIAVILYDRKQRARTWAPVTEGATSIVVFDDQACATLPPGTIEPSVGDHVELAWIDAAGRPSEHSTGVDVTR